MLNPQLVQLHGQGLDLLLDLNLSLSDFSEKNDDSHLILDQSVLPLHVAKGGLLL